MVTCGSDPKSGRASPVELPPSPLSGSRGQKMRVREKGLSFYIWGGSLPPPYRADGLPAAPPPGSRCLPPGRGAPGSLLKYKTPPLPSAPSFSAHEIQRGERERGGVREVKNWRSPARFWIRTAGNQYFSTIIDLFLK